MILNFKTSILPTPTFILILMSTTAIGTLMAISSSSWLTMWFGLVINLISMSPIMNMNKSTSSLEASMKYFITQSLAATVMIMMLFLTPHLTTPYVWLILTSSLMLKLGIAPLHFWVPQVIPALPWTQILILSTWQKIAPLAIIMNCLSHSHSWALIIFSIYSIILGMLGAWTASSLKLLIAYSSIHHSGWLILLSTLDYKTTIIYFILYFSQMAMLILILNFSIKTKIPPYLTPPHTINKPLIYFTLTFFSMAALPPFLGFIPKMMTLTLLMTQLPPILTLVPLIISTLLMTSVYLALALNTMKASLNLLTPPHPLMLELGTSMIMTLIMFLPLTLMLAL